MSTRHFQDILDSVKRLRAYPSQTIELRALGVPSRHGRPHTVAGWFGDHDQLAQAAAQLDERRAAGIYVTLNGVNPQLLARAHNRLDEHPKATTADRDIVRRLWLPFDFDPVRPAGISSSPDELEVAKQKALRTAEWLEEQLGNPPDIWAFSGNGYHLLFRIDMPSEERVTRGIKRVLEVTSALFSDEWVKVDRTVFNPARIWKLYGTTARKGDEVPEQGRLHRRARILGRNFTDD